MPELWSEAQLKAAKEKGMVPIYIAFDALVIGDREVGKMTYTDVVPYVMAKDVASLINSLVSRSLMMFGRSGHLTMQDAHASHIGEIELEPARKPDTFASGVPRRAEEDAGSDSVGPGVHERERGGTILPGASPDGDSPDEQADGN